MKMNTRISHNIFKCLDAQKKYAPQYVITEMYCNDKGEIYISLNDTKVIIVYIFGGVEYLVITPILGREIYFSTFLEAKQFENNNFNNL